MFDFGLGYLYEVCNVYVCLSCTFAVHTKPLLVRSPLSWLVRSVFIRVLTQLGE